MACLSQGFNRSQPRIEDLRAHPLELYSERDGLAAAEQMGDTPLAEGGMAQSVAQVCRDHLIERSGSRCRTSEPRNPNSQPTE